MIKKSNIKIFKKLFFLTVIFSIIFISPFFIKISNLNGNSIEASSDDLYEELERLKKELAQIEKDKQDLNSRIDSEKSLQNSLSAQIYNLNNSIAELELNIKEKEVDIEKKDTEIKILEEEITEAKQQIDNIGKDVSELEDTANDIIKTIYVESKTNSMIDLLLTSEASKSFMSQLQYHTAIGSNDQKTLEELEHEKEILEEQREAMEEDKLEVEQLTEQIKKQKELLEKDREQLSAQRIQKNRLYSQSQENIESYSSLLDNLSDEEKINLAHQARLQQELFNQFGEIISGQYVVKGTIIGKEGQTGYAFGEHLHFTITKDGLRYWGELSPYCAAYGCNPNPCNYLPAGVGGCGISGSPLEWPMRGCYYYTSPWGPRCLGGHCSFHDAIDLSYCWSQKYTNDYIYAVHDGWVQYGTMSDGCKYAIICENHNCNIGYKSGYFHLE